MKNLLTIVAALVLFVALATSGLAARNPSGAGQPNQTCLESSATALEPGHASSSPGSPFNESLPGKAGTVYAGTGANVNTPANAAAVSQYDVACFQVTQPH